MKPPKGAGEFKGRAKRGKEKKYNCLICGDKKGNLEVSQTTGKYHCWRCGFSGRLPTGRTDGDSGSGVRHSAGTATPSVPVVGVPERARLYIQHRGFDPEWVVREYGALWDGQRLCFPTGGGFARRSINDWDTPKVLVTGLQPSEGALIGIERLARYPGAAAVLTQGDFKAVSIPLPWVGLGTMGARVHPLQVERIRQYTDKITLFNDSAPEEAFQGAVRGFTALTTPAPYVGPDDIPMRERVRLLLGE